MGKAALKDGRNETGKRGNADGGNTPGIEKTLSAVLLVLFGMILLSVFLWSGTFGQIFTTIFSTVYYAEATADVTAEGQRHQLMSIAKCVVIGKAMWGGLVGKANSTTIEGGLLVKRQLSGAGLMVICPVLSDKSDLTGIIHKEKFHNTNAVRRVDLQKYLDFWKSRRWSRVLLSSDAEDSSLITSCWKECVTRPAGASVQVYNVTYQRNQSDNLEEPEREVPRLDGRETPIGIVCRHKPWNWFGHYTHAVPDDDWCAASSDPCGRAI